jgi:fatty-acyl-CoA synthase
MTVRLPGPTYIERLSKRLIASGDRTCLTHDGRDIAASDLLSRMHRYARALQALGLRSGDVVAILAPNHPDALAIRYAAHWIGAASSFLPPLARAQDRAELIRAIDPNLLVVFEETHSLVPAGSDVPLATVGSVPRPGLRLDEATAQQSSRSIACLARPEDLCVISASGGSTGASKGSRRSFAAYTAMVDAPSPEDRRQLINGPFAYLSQVLVDITLLGGGTVVLRNRYEAADTLETIATERITDLFLVEPQLFELMDHSALATADLSSLRTLTHIGASAPPALRLRARQRFGPRIVHTYGASEAGLVSVLPAAEADPGNPERFHSAGRVLPRVQVRLRRDDGSLAEGVEPGIIEIRSPAMAEGYRNRPDLEAAVFRDGWYRSGDLGRIDADGYLHILGRSADIEIGDGVLVTPTLIEDTLCRVSGLRYASVVVDQDRARRIAAIVAWPGLAVDCIACRRAVATEFGEDVAETIAFLPCEAVPLTPQGKPDRQTIRALAGAAVALPRASGGAASLA